MQKTLDELKKVIADHPGELGAIFDTDDEAAFDFIAHLPEKIQKLVTLALNNTQVSTDLKKYLCRRYQNDEERKEQDKAEAMLLTLYISNTPGMETPFDEIENETPFDSFAEYIEKISTDDLQACAATCYAGKREEWGAQFEALAGEWDTLTPEAKGDAVTGKGDKIGRYASVFLFRCVLAKVENKPPATIPEELPTTAIYTDETFYLPIDHISRQFFPQEIANQMQFLPEIGRGEDASEMISCDFSKLPENVKGKLTSFDKRVACAYFSLAKIQKDEAPNEPYKAITKGDICRRMKIDADSTNNKKNVLESMRKMSLLPTRLDRRNDFTGGFETVYQNYFIPCAITPGTNHITGEIIPECFIPLTNDASYLTKSPVPYITFAEDKGEITAFDCKYLDTSWQTTENHIAIEDYILRRVQTYKNHMRKGEAWENSRTIVIDEIFKECNITDRRTKNKLREDIDKKLLPDYIKMGLFTVKGREYKTTKDKEGATLPRDQFKGLVKFEFEIYDPRKIATRKK